MLTARATALSSLLALVAGSAFGQLAMKTAFLTAKPVWPAGKELTKNLTVGFRADFLAPPSGKVLLRSTGSTVYRVFLNGRFLSYGPARGPHDYYRVDELDITKLLEPGSNTVAFEVAGYNVNSFYLLDQPSFLQAEVVSGGHVLASTGAAHPFSAGILPERVQKAQRYSFQRPFSEMYRLEPGFDRWMMPGGKPFPPTAITQTPKVKLLDRHVAFPKFATRRPTQLVSTGDLTIGAPIQSAWKDRSLTGIGAQLGGFLESELDSIPSIELQSVSNKTNLEKNSKYSSKKTLLLGAKTFAILDFGLNTTGFIRSRLKVTKPSRVHFTFDEILTNGEVDFKRLGCVNIVTYDLKPGTYDLESFEPYTFRYLKIQAVEGECEVSRVELREYVSPIPATAKFASSDDRLNRLFQAGVETFRQNAVDVFMDCPSRERAGWLCDSFFTARVAKDLMGSTTIEKNLFENYQLPEKFKFLPEGMLPMCYPSDHNDGVFIPNWALWFVVELEEYLQRSGDKATVAALEPRLNKLLDYFKRFRNSDGLLEKLESWVFIEWSNANSFVQDVNYPSNMLYAESLAAMGRMYNRKDLLDDAAKIRETIRNQSFNGDFFVDNAVRRNGKLEVTTNTSEVCQYFAYFFHVATPESHPKLWKTLVTDFGPNRSKTKAFPQVHPANAFVGNVIRLELLSRAGLAQQLLDESLAYQLYMVDRTGTLWENDGAYASCNHGFASHGGVRVLYRDILGLQEVDTVKKAIQIRFTDLKLEHCKGSMPTPHGTIELSWKRTGNELSYRLRAPKGYSVKVDNQTKLTLSRD